MFFVKHKDELKGPFAKYRHAKEKGDKISKRTRDSVQILELKKDYRVM